MNLTTLNNKPMLQKGTPKSSDLGTLLLFVSLYEKFTLVYSIHIYFEFVSKTKNVFYGIENFLPATPNWKVCQGKSN